MKVAVDGSGPGLVLVHGAGPGAEVTWGGLVDRFTDQRTVVRPDLSGSAAAPHDEGGPLSLELLAGEVVAAIEDAGEQVAPVDLVGFSLGAPVASAVAATRPDLVRRLVLVAGFSRTDEYLRNLATVWLRMSDDAKAFGRFGALTAFGRDFLERLGREGVDQLVPNMRPAPSLLRQLDLILRLDVGNLLPRIEAETLVIGCAEDRTAPPANARELHAAIATSRYAEIDSGHVVMFEQPDRLAELVREFILAA